MNHFVLRENPFIISLNWGYAIIKGCVLTAYKTSAGGDWTKGNNQQKNGVLGFTKLGKLRFPDAQGAGSNSNIS